MTPAASLEDFYEALAQAIDEVGHDNEPLLLTKLALLLADALGDPAQAVVLINEATKNLR